MGKTTTVKSLAPILIVLGLASIYGFWYQNTRGKIRAPKPATTGLNEAVLGAPLGSRGTLVQFSSAFCTPCRATRVLIENVVKDLPDIKHIEIDAEAHLDLVRSLNIRSTPTTLVLDSSGIEIGRAIGAPKQEQILSAIDSLR